MGANTLLALTPDLAYFKAWGLMVIGESLLRPGVIRCLIFLA